jgi:hypothetical protein
MNYKEMLDKLAELESRIDALERGQRKQTPLPGAPQFTPQPTQPSWFPQNPWPKNLDITCKGTLQ